MSALPAYESTVKVIKKRHAECKSSKSGSHRFKTRGKKRSKFKRCSACHLEVSES